MSARTNVSSSPVWDDVMCAGGRLIWSNDQMKEVEEVNMGGSKGSTPQALPLRLNGFSPHLKRHTWDGLGRDSLSLPSTLTNTRADVCGITCSDLHSCFNAPAHLFSPECLPMFSPCRNGSGEPGRGSGGCISEPSGQGFPITETQEELQHLSDCPCDKKE